MESVVRAAIGGSFTTLAEVLRYNIGVPALWRRYSRNSLKQTSGSRKKTALPAVEGGPMKATAYRYQPAAGESPYSEPQS